ncbi:hypothetical protein PP707_02930 [Acetobacter pasteurianus]|nr:hypothetical protein [Acetobacter pasteurianus]
MVWYEWGRRLKSNQQPNFCSCPSPPHSNTPPNYLYFSSSGVVEDDDDETKQQTRDKMQYVNIMLQLCEDIFFLISKEILHLVIENKIKKK